VGMDRDVRDLKERLQFVENLLLDIHRVIVGPTREPSPQQRVSRSPRRESSRGASSRRHSPTSRRSPERRTKRSRSQERAPFANAVVIFGDESKQLTDAELMDFFSRYGSIDYVGNRWKTDRWNKAHDKREPKWAVKIVFMDSDGFTAAMQDAPRLLREHLIECVPNKNTRKK
jgi:hypothetical protein